MAIRKRKTKTGVTAEYHYEFMQNKKRYFGVCEGCTTERSAREYEKRVKEQVKELAEQKSARKLVENFRDQLAGGGAILLKDGYREAQQKPRKHIPSPPRNQLKNAHWNDFVSFMAATYPEITRLSQVTRKHAEDYISFLRTKGRYNTRIVYTRGSKEIVSNSDGPLANATLIDYQTTLTEVFTLLHEDAGIIDNPFAGIPKPPRNSETREAFTEEELKVIGENLDSFTKPLFYMATTTALREGDICTLLWSEVNFQENVISRARMNKTGRPVEIPIMGPLLNYLLELQRQQRDRPADEYTKYVLPEHARMYLMNPTGVSYRIKQFLENTCGIKTTRTIPGRKRANSVKDLHSCRHTFCYYAGIYGIPLNVVQSIVGHMTPEMTKHYSDHATREIKRQKMALMPSFLISEPHQQILADGSANRMELKKIIDQLSEQEVEQLLLHLKHKHIAEHKKELPVLENTHDAP